MAIAFGLLLMLAPIPVQAQGRISEQGKTPEPENCLLDTSNGRWVPSGMPQMQKVSGATRGPQIRYAGRIGEMSAYVTDFRCDYIAFEVTLVGTNDLNIAPFLAVFRKIEKAAGVSNVSRLSDADLISLQKKRHFNWKRDREVGEIVLGGSDLTTVISAYYENRSY
jgi:hypothetical protein